MNKQQAYQIWEELFGDKEVAYDFASHPMKKEDFQNENSHYSWDIDEKKPFLNRKDNFIPCSLNTIRFRQGKPSFKVGNNLFEVRKGKSYGSFAIYDVTDRNHPINMDPTEENQDPAFNRERFHSIAVSKVKNPRFMVPTMKSISDKVFNEVLEKEEMVKEKPQLIPLQENETKEVAKETSAIKKEQDVLPSKPDIIMAEEEEIIETPAIEEKKEFDTEIALQNLSSVTSRQISQKEETKEDSSTLLSVIEDLKKQIDENLNEIDSLNQQVSSLNSEKEILGQKNIQLTEERNKAVSLKEDIQKQHQIEKDSLQSNLDALLKANDALKNQIVELKSQKEEMETEKDSLLSQLSTSKDANTELSIQINEIQNQSADRDEKLDELKKANEELEGKIQKLEEEKSSFEQEKEAAYVSLSNEKNSFDEHLKELNEKISLMESEKDADLQKYENLLNEKESLSVQLEEKNQENDILRQQLSSKEEGISSFQLDLDALKNEKESLISKIEELKKKEEEQNTVNLSLNEQLKNEKDSLLEKENQIQSLSFEKESFGKKNEELNSSLIEIQSKNSLKEEELLRARENIASLSNEKEEISEQLNAEKKQKEILQANYNSLEEQSSLMNDQLLILDSENKRLILETQEKDSKLEELNVQIENMNIETENLKKNQLDDSIKEKLSSIDSLNEKVNQLNEEIVSIQKEKEEKEQELSQTKDVYEDQLRKKDDSIEEIQKENDRNIRLIKYLSLGGKMEYFTSLEQYLLNNSLSFNDDEIQKALKMHREWKVKDEEKLESINGESRLLASFDATLLDEEIKKREKALFYFEQIYGDDKFKVSDFAGRFISLSEYGSKDKEDGWDYDLLDESKEESLDNVFIANYRSLKDYLFDKPFDSNGHRFQVVKEGEKNKIVSADYIADPYDFTQALRVTKNNQGNSSPLIYLFVKVVGLNTSEPDRTALMEFFDLLDRTVKRCCPISFIEMKTIIGSGKGNYAFITFDGSIEESYHETLDYALLLNSYRREYRMEGKLNAVIVLNEVDVPFSKRHLDYDALLSETRDDELRALRYEFNMAVINSIIKRTLHIGPRILNKLAVDHSLLTESQIGQGNFAKMYCFKKAFKVYNFVYSLTHKEENSKD